MIEGIHYQNGYVTPDIEAALAWFRDQGIADGRAFEVTVPVTTPVGSGTATTRLAFLQVGNLQYELIEPVAGLVDLYREALPERGVRFHHACMRVEDWDAFRQRVAKQGWPVAIEGGGDALRFLYLDARPFLGHYLEYVWATPERWAQMGLSF